MRRVSAADVLVAGCAVTLSVADVHFLRHDRELVTSTLRRPPVLLALTVLTLHAWNLLGWLDPFRFVGRRIQRC